MVTRFARWYVKSLNIKMYSSSLSLSINKNKQTQQLCSKESNNESVTKRCEHVELYHAIRTLP